MQPVNGEVPQVDWPVVVIGQRSLVVRWTFYAQWLLSKRRVNIKELGPLLSSTDVPLVDVLVELFAACVAENWTKSKLDAPSADYWAAMISDHGGLPKWTECIKAVFDAMGKAPAAAAPPAPAEPATTGQQTLN